MSRFRKWAAAMAVMVGAGVLPVVGATPAGAIGTGCANLNLPLFDGLWHSGGTGGSFDAGDHIVITAAAPSSTGASTAVSLQIPGGTVVDSDAFPGTLEYTFPAATTTAVVWTANGGDVTWSVSCVPGPPPDTSDPTLAPSVSPNPVLLGGTATASPNASDPGGSGIASSSCDPVDTSTVGTHTVSCTATDNAGNTANATAEYRVVYGFSGFASPVDGNDVVNQAKAGQAIPLKFRLTDSSGAPFAKASEVAVTVSSLACGVGTTTDAVEEYAAGSSGLQNLGNGFYQWNWKSPKTYAGSCKTLHLDAGDGNVHTALFSFTK